MGKAHLLSVVYLPMDVQVSGQASAGLPPLVANFIRSLQYSQLAGILPPSPCLGHRYAFVIEVAYMSLALLFTGLAVLSVVAASLTVKAHRIFVFIAGGLFTALSLAYPLVCNTVLTLLTTSTVTMTDVAQAQLDGSPLSISDAAVLHTLHGAAVTSTVLAANPYYLAWQGAHKSAAALAVVCLVVYCIGYPLVMLFWVQYHLQRYLMPRDVSFAAVVRQWCLHTFSAIGWKQLASHGFNDTNPHSAQVRRATLTSSLFNIYASVNAEDR
jgi:hypothetical protein